MTQLTLPEPNRRSDGPMEANRLARSGDGPGSHAAAERIVRSGKAASARQRVLDAIKRYPGRTSKALAQLGGLDRHLVARRTADCFRLGLVTRTAGDPPGCEWRWWPA